VDGCIVMLLYGSVIIMVREERFSGWQSNGVRRRDLKAAEGGSSCRLVWEERLLTG
jgi:hypothetical protein